MLRWIRRSPPTTVPVLLYHSIADSALVADPRWTVSRREFLRHGEAIAGSGRRALTITELGACLRGERALPERAVVVTFDDGYADVVEAAEALSDRGISSTIYVTTGLLGRHGMLSPRGLVQLAGLGSVEVGAHAVHHDRLDELSGTRLGEEVRGSKARLEDLTHVPVTSFAYPYGAYDRRTRAAVIAAGYEAAAAVKNALSHAGDDPFAIARWTVTHDTSAHRIGDVLEGRGLPLAWGRERTRTRAGRTARRLRRIVAVRQRENGGGR